MMATTTPNPSLAIDLAEKYNLDLGKPKLSPVPVSDGTRKRKNRVGVAPYPSASFKLPEGEPSARFRAWRKIAATLGGDIAKPPAELPLTPDLLVESAIQLVPDDSPPLVVGTAMHTLDTLPASSLILFWSQPSGLQVLRLTSVLPADTSPQSDSSATALTFSIVGWCVDASIPAIPFPAVRVLRSQQDPRPLVVPSASLAVVDYLFQQSPTLYWDPAFLTSALDPLYPTGKKKASTQLPATHATAASFLHNLFTPALTVKSPTAPVEDSSDSDDGSTPITGNNGNHHALVSPPPQANLNSLMSSELASALIQSINGKSEAEKSKEKDSWGKNASTKLPIRFFELLSDPTKNQLKHSVQLTIHSFVNNVVARDAGGAKSYFPTTLGELRGISEGWRLRTRTDLLMFLPLNETFGINAFTRHTAYTALGDGTLSSSNLKTLDALLTADSTSILNGNLSHWKTAVTYFTTYLIHILQPFPSCSASLLRAKDRLFTFVSRHNQGLLPTLVGDLLLDVSYQFSLDIVECAMSYVSDLASPPCPVDVFGELPWLTPTSPIPHLFAEAVSRTSVRWALMKEEGFAKLTADAPNSKALKPDPNPGRQQKAKRLGTTPGKTGRREGGGRDTIPTANADTPPNPGANAGAAAADAVATNRWICASYSTVRGCNKTNCPFAHRAPRSPEEADRLRQILASWPNASAFTATAQQALARFPPRPAAPQAQA